MSVAMGIYDYFVGSGDGIIYIFIYGFLVFTTGLYLVKIYFPSEWLALFGFSGGGELWNPKTEIWNAEPGKDSIISNVFRPFLRAAFAGIILLQIKPGYITHFVIDPFLEFGNVYVESMTQTIVPTDKRAVVDCPASLNEYLSKNSCNFLMRPIAEVSAVNVAMIKEGLKFIQLSFKFDFLSKLTGLAIIITFFGANLFMSLLLVRGIFDFGMALVLYPFKVLVYVIKKPDDNSLWVDPWPPFEDIIKSLQKLIVSMIAVAFIMMINIAVSESMFKFSIFRAWTPDFGAHAMTFLTSVIMFLVMGKIYNMVNERLEKYVDNGEMTGFYGAVAEKTKHFAGKAVGLGKKVFGTLKSN